MKILLVDDLQPKIQKVVKFIVETCGIPRDNILVAQTATDARRILLDTQVDLLILDIVLPLRAEDPPAEEVSLGLLEDLIEGELYKKPGFVLGLTAYEQADALAAPQFKEHLWTVIRFDDSSNEWGKPLCNCIEYIRARLSQRNVRDYEVDLCIVCALEDPELRAVLRLPWNWEPATPLDDTTFIHRGSLRSGEKMFSVVAAVASRMGMVSTALLATKLISSLAPRFIAMVGICAGVRDKTRLGDVIFCDPTWDWQSGKRIKDKENSQFAIAPHQLPAKEFLRTRAQQLATDSDLWHQIRSGWITPPANSLRLLPGPLASGSAVLADGQVVSEIKTQERNLLGIDMECYGIFAAVSSACFPRPSAIAFKSVCDFADPDKRDDMQAYAAYTSASALQHYFERYLNEIYALQ